MINVNLCSYAVDVCDRIDCEMLSQLLLKLYQAKVSQKQCKYQSSFLLSIDSFRKGSLALLKKMVIYIQPALLEEIIKPDASLSTPSVAAQLAEVLSVVLNTEVSQFYFKRQC